VAAPAPAPPKGLAQTYRLDIGGDANITGTYRVNGVPISATSNWTLAGNNIYYATGNVGIGTTTPATLLDVAGRLTVAGVTAYGSGNWFTDPSIDGTGIMGLAHAGSAAWGVYGGSDSGVGVRGHSGAIGGVGGYFSNGGGGKAMSAMVSGSVIMTADAEGVHAGPGMTGTPLAYGSFAADGSKTSGSENITCVWSAPPVTRYECAVAGYTAGTHVAVVTAVSLSGEPIFATTSTTATGVLIVRLFNATAPSVKVSGIFHLVIFRP
jgi:hypothetical protein